MRSQELKRFNLLLLTLTATFGCIVSLNRGTFLAGDFFFLIQPLQHYVSELLQRGQFPLWNPYLDCGVPLLANLREAVFYPPLLIFRFFDIVLANRAFLLFHYFLAGSLGYWAARALRCSRPGAFLISVLLSFNGFFFLHSAYFNHIAGIAWIPAGILLMRPPKNLWEIYVLPALILTLQFLSGNPFFAYAGLLLMLFHAVFTAARFPEKILPFAKRWAGIGLLTALLTGAQLLPFAESVLRSSRSGGMNFADAMTFSEPPAQMIRSLLTPLWSWRGFETEGDPTVTGIYVGLATLFLIVLGLKKNLRGPKTFFWISVLCLSAVFSFGKHFPGYEHLWRIFPGMKFFRFPAQWLCLFVPACAFLAARGIKALPRAAALTAIALLIFELFMFASKNPFGIVYAGFFREIPPMAFRVTSRNPVPRISHVQKGFGLGNERLENAGDWMEAQTSLVPNLSLPYHIPSSSGYATAKTRAKEDIAQRSAQNAADLQEWMRISASEILCVYRKEEDRGQPSQYDFKSLPRLGLFSSRRFDLEDPGLILPRLDKESETKILISIPEFPDGKELYFADTFYPGWEVYLDGAKGEIIQAEEAFRSVKIPAGTKQAAFVFRPKSFRFGAALTLLGILAAALPTGLYFRNSLSKTPVSPPQNG